MSGNFAKEISRNIIKELKQLLKKICVNFVLVKCGRIFIKVYPLFEKIMEKILR